VERAPEKWAKHTNRALQRAGREARLDHRSYARQGIDRDPSEHYGPAAAYRLGRGREHDQVSLQTGRLHHASEIEIELSAGRLALR
jgi:hypothetical protein